MELWLKQGLIFFKEVAHSLSKRVWGEIVNIAGTLAAFPTALYPQNTGILVVKATPPPASPFEIGSSVA